MLVTGQKERRGGRRLPRGREAATDRPPRKRRPRTGDASLPPLRVPATDPEATTGGEGRNPPDALPPGPRRRAEHGSVGARAGADALVRAGGTTWLCASLLGPVMPSAPAFLGVGGRPCPRGARHLRACGYIIRRLTPIPIVAPRRIVLDPLAHSPGFARAAHAREFPSARTLDSHAARGETPRSRAALFSPKCTAPLCRDDPKRHEQQTLHCKLPASTPLRKVQASA